MWYITGTDIYGEFNCIELNILILLFSRCWFVYKDSMYMLVLYIPLVIILTVSSISKIRVL